MNDLLYPFNSYELIEAKFKIDRKWYYGFLGAFADVLQPCTLKLTENFEHDIMFSHVQSTC